MQRAWQIDLSRCIGCRACEVSCIQELNTGPDVRYRRVLPIETGKYPNNTRIFVTMTCFHCEAPSCKRACPVGAISKDPDDGVVIIDNDKCIGCRRCNWACPYGAPRFNKVTQKSEKCTFCKHRVGDDANPNHIPACVATCLGKALIFGRLNQDITPQSGDPIPKGFADKGLTKPAVRFVD
jgi:anaerobic dimethyl sulfoxide reductase subunit B (iron-sulfur subunit)